LIKYVIIKTTVINPKNAVTVEAGLQKPFNLEFYKPWLYNLHHTAYLKHCSQREVVAHLVVGGGGSVGRVGAGRLGALPPLLVCIIAFFGLRKYYF